MKCFITTHACLRGGGVVMGWSWFQDAPLLRRSILAQLGVVNRLTVKQISVDWSDSARPKVLAEKLDDGQQLS